MKRNQFPRLFAGSVRPAALAALLACCLPTACRDDSEDNGQLSEGEYPVLLTAAVERFTSAIPEDTWAGGEQIAVEAKSNMPGAQPEIKTYTADASGNLTSGVPSWWTNTSEQMTLRAWYCGDGSTAEGEANALTVPSEWSVQSDQSGEGATDGYKSSDLLFAPAMTSAFPGRAAVPLKFYHQTAKVVVNILNAKAVTDAAKIRAVRIGDGNMVLEAGFSAPVAGAAVGTWDTASAASDGTIIPHKLTKPAEPDYIATYVALVIPQPTADKLMVTVETVFGTMCYTAPEGAGHLEAGKVRTYNITVYTDRLEVSVADDSGKIDSKWTELCPVTTAPEPEVPADAVLFQDFRGLAYGGNNVYTAFGGGVNDSPTGKALDQIFVPYEKYCNANSSAANLYTTHIEAYRTAVGLEDCVGGNNAAGHTGNNSVYGATGMLKLGTGSALGWLQTPALTRLTAPTDIEVSFSACCWWEDISKSTPSDSPEIKVMVVGPGTIGGQTEQRVQISEKSEMKSYKVRVDGATADTHIEFSAVFIKEGGLTNRWFLDDVLIVPAK